MTRQKSKALLIGAVAALSVTASLGAAAAVTTPTQVQNTSATAAGSNIDGLIDAVVAQKVAMKRLTAASAALAREQMQLQFKALSPAAQQALLTKASVVSDAESALRIEAALLNATQADARRVLAEMQADKAAARGSDAAERGQRVQARLGGDGDYVFVPTVGPCRVADSRFDPAGQLPATGARQIYAYSVSNYDFSQQGGTGIAGSGNCAGASFPTDPGPVSVVATVAVLNTTSSGSMRAWNGGTTLTVGGILGWNAGQVLSNTTVIPLNRDITAYANSGFKRDFALYNNSGNSVDYVVDVVGYFIENRATPLECETIVSADTDIPANSSIFVNSPSCSAGYTGVAMGTTLGTGLYSSTLNENGCRIGNLTAGVLVGTCDIRCCRVPGR